MAVLALLTLAVLAGSAYSTPQASRIVGGSETSIEKYPSLVAVENYALWSGVWTQTCAGNILTARYVLSAARCFYGALYDIRNRRFRAGSSYRNSGGIVSYATGAYNHPTWTTNGLDGDISVVRLATPWVYSPVVQRATIVTQGFQIPDYLPVVLAGWGYTSEEGGESSILLSTTVYTINRNTCASLYAGRPEGPVLITDNMICAGIANVGGRDACYGDAGGPLYFGDYLIGIISWGSCGDADYPGVSTAVSSYTDWILSKVID